MKNFLKHKWVKHYGVAMAIMEYYKDHTDDPLYFKIISRIILRFHMIMVNIYAPLLERVLMREDLKQM